MMNLAVIFLTADIDVMAGSYRGLCERFTNSGINCHVYSEGNLCADGVSCTSGTAHANINDVEYRLEELFPHVLHHYSESVKWFVFTRADTWWNINNLGAELARIEASVYPATPQRDILVVGGGGFIVFSCFLILSKPALIYLSNQTLLDQCRQSLLDCRPYEYRTPNEFAQMRSLGCHFKGPGSGRESRSYTASSLVNYCAAEPLALGKCGPSLIGCEWRFGRLARETIASKVFGNVSSNEMARRRFRQNPRRANIRAIEHEIPKYAPVECSSVMCSLVAIEHADNETQSYLNGISKKQIASGCCRYSGT